MITINDTTLFRAAQTCAAEAREVRYFLQGVLLRPDGTVVGTDGHRMFIAKDCVTDVTQDTIIRLDKILPVSAFAARLDTDRRVAVFETTRGSNAIPYSVIDGKFPDYESITKGKVFGKAGVKIMGVNASYLHDVQKVMKAEGCAVEFSSANGGPMKVTFIDSEIGVDYYEYIVMPVRV